MKSNFFLILLVILIILAISLIYLKIVQKDKRADNDIENERKLNHNLKTLLKSKLSIYNLFKNYENQDLRKLDENDLIILEKKETTDSLNDDKKNNNK